MFSLSIALCLTDKYLKLCSVGEVVQRDMGYKRE